MPTPSLGPDFERDPHTDFGLDRDPPHDGLKRPLEVLLIEDNPDDAFLLERHLRRNGFDTRIVRVETADAMREALAALSDPALTSSIVIADYNLPAFSGPEALRILKASGIDLPFLMMSGAVSEEAAVESMRAGAQDYVTKQNLARLVPAIERELKEASARRNRVAAELALRASESRFHRLVEAMPLGLLIGEASGRIVYANSAVERMLGYTTTPVAVGSFAVAGSLTLNSICSTLEDTIAATNLDGSGSTPPFEATCVAADGRSIDVLIGIALLNPEASRGERQVAAFIADLTRQKKSEQVLRLTEKLAVTGRFATSIAHEINNPLEAITNCLYLMGQGELNPDARSYLEMAQTELDLVSKITMQTLRFYRSSGRQQLTDVQDLIGSVLDLLDRRLRQQGIAIERRLRTIQPILAHDGEVRQVLANLVGNAIDALPLGGRLIIRTSSAHNWHTGVPGVRITIADDGVGMDADTRQRIFEAFFSTKGITGTGLGLWISGEIVAKHQGRLNVRSRRRSDTLSGGTVFALFLPLEPTLPLDPTSNS
jgi:PAS domain S-box-containing protein